jgi:hypothetical protein
MGGEPYFYIVPYQDDIVAALEDLRQREFQAGRYNPVVPFPGFSPSTDSPSPGARHPSIADALAAADANGTRSILDLDRISMVADFGAVVRLDESALRRYFRSTHPTREVVQANYDFWDSIERGQGIYIVLYKGDDPDEIFFAGYSYD